ncbi:MAG: class I SAM-dependent methyltransferase [Alphaproteobacteria bacterium]|nr:class I SAM-dependent methyltransferase [Alphaproteobacteria bacterium]
MHVFALIFVIVLVVCIEIYWLVRCVEFVWAGEIKHQIPFVATSGRMRMAVVNEIKRNYPKSKTVCDIGSGYGGMARFVARKCGGCVYALENMPFTYAMARVLDFMSGAHGVNTLYVDAFRWLGEYDGVFDIGIAYLGPVVNDKLVEYQDKFRVLFVLDVPISDAVPTRVVDIGGGCTSYGRTKYPHKLFVYEFVPND